MKRQVARPLMSLALIEGLNDQSNVSRVVSEPRTGPAEQSVDPPGGPEINLVGHEHGEELRVGEVIGFGFHDPGIEVLPDAGELQEPELQQQLVFHEGPF
jgi:hypothetical protein